MEIASKTRDELRVIAKEMQISGRGSMTKAQLIEAIEAKLTEGGESEQQASSEQAGKQVEADEAAAGSVNKNGVNVKYIETAEPGAIMAFKLPDGKVKSAKLVKRSIKRKMLLLVTSYGKEYKIPFDYVMWVKTGRKWPKFIYNMFEGKGVAEGEKQRK